MSDGNFDLSAVMRFDGTQAAQSARQTAAAIKEVATATKEANDASRGAGGAGAGPAADTSATKANADAKREAAVAAKEKATADKAAADAARKLAADEAALERELQKVRDRLDPAAAATRKLAQETDLLDTALARGKITIQQHAAEVERLTKATKGGGAASDEAAKAANRNAFGLRNLGQQVGDFATQVSLGGGFVRAFASQAGQAGFAMSEMGGKIGAVGAFLTGPWGIALTVASLALAPLVEGLLSTEKAAKLAEVGTSALATAQGALGDVFDLTTGKLKGLNSELTANNELLRLNARLTAINLRAEAAQKRQSSGETFNSAGQQSFAGKAAGFLQRGLNGGVDGPFFQADARSQANAANLGSIVDRVRSGKLSQESALRTSEGVDFTGTKTTRAQFQQAIIDAATAQANDAIAGLIDKSLDDGKLATGLKRETKAKKPKKPADTDGFVNSVEGDISSITAAFTDAPTFIEKARAAVKKLDYDIAQLAKRKPPNFQSLIDQAELAKAVVEANINKPFDDYIKAQQDALAVEKLTAAGRVDEAAALRVVQGLQKQMGPLTEEQRDAVLATVQAIKAEQRETEILRDRQQAYLNALGSIREAVRGVIFDGVGGLKELPGRLVQAFATLKGEQLFDKLFDGAFRELQDQATGTKVVKDASDRMGKAVDGVTSKSKALGDAFDGLAAKARAAAPGSSTTTGDGSSTAPATVLDATGKVIGTFAAPAAPVPDNNGGEIVVNGNKKKSPREFISGAIEKLANGVGISPEAAATIGKKSGQAIEGAAKGAFANSIFEPLAKGLGLKTSKTGAQIGGALGGLTGLPFAGEIGGILGSITGGLFKKTKSGSATITSAFDAFTTGGNDGASIKAASGLASSVQSGLKSIADQLGGTLGGFNVTVGQRHGDYRVTTGSSLKVNKGAKDFNDDAAAANAYAIQVAITQGAVQGLSSAIQQALKSSDDIDAALAEALKVKNLETLIGGLGSTLKQVFTSFDATATERLRIAEKYGLDVAAVEKINAEERVKLVDDTLKSRISSLSDFLSSIKYGDLFEGSATDRRNALLAEIATVQKDAEAGKDGSADKLASLYSQLTSTSRDAFGTAGTNFSSDRAAAISGVERVIQMETQRVNDAASIQKATVDAIKAGTAQQSETNNLTAITNSKLDSVIASIQGLYGSGTGNSAVAREARAGTFGAL